MSMTKKYNLDRERPLHSLQMDKGKRHYWQDMNSDYGVKQSNGRRLHELLLQQGKVNREQFSQKNTIQQTQGILYHSLKHKHCCQNENRQKILDNNKNRLKINSKNIQIKLPNINSRKDIATQSEDVRFHQNLEKYNHNLGALETKIRPIKVQNVQDEQRKVRVKTQFNQYTKKTRKVRYSPTYVCSIRNPLPTFKLYNPETQNPVYTYGFNDENQ